MILSAQDHFAQRAAQRETWVEVFKNNGITYQGQQLTVVPRFVVGDAACNIPPAYRRSTYSCEAKELLNPILNQPIYVHSVPTMTGTTTAAANEAFDFETQHWLSVRKLGVFDSDANGLGTDVVVRLYDRSSRKVVLEARLGAEATRIGSMVWMDVLGVVLPRGFKGTLAVSGLTLTDPVLATRDEALRTTGGGLVHIESYRRYGLQPNTYPDVVAPPDAVNPAHIVAGSFQFDSVRTTPASTYTLAWKSGLSYPVVSWKSMLCHVLSAISVYHAYHSMQVKLYEQDSLQLSSSKNSLQLVELRSEDTWTACKTDAPNVPCTRFQRDVIYSWRLCRSYGT
jgi:hypothetical protein